MIHYELQCADDHRFDGWFRDSAAFESQQSRGLLECPSCGGTSVMRALMAPAVPRKRRGVIPAAPQQVAVPAPAAAPPAAVAARLPDEVRAMLQRMRSEVEKHCDYVGDAFADEARKIHLGESDPRGIYGEATPEQAEALQEDGIEVARIPWLPRADA
jgi:hypothetical protein